jgi:hypothetical protein
MLRTVVDLTQSSLYTEVEQMGIEAFYDDA